MKSLLMSLTLSFTFIATAHAQAPAGSTGSCKDGTYTSADSKMGACRGHKGVKEWYAGASAPSPAADAPTTKSKASRKSKSDDSAASPPATASAGKPADATGLCKDGSYTTADSKKGACRGHKGVKDWYVSAPPAAPLPAPKPSSPAPATKASAPVPAPMPAPGVAPARPAPQAPPETRTAAAGGGAGKVWLNTETKVYHCANDRYYGKTKQGEYLSEADALAKGAHGSHGKPCAK